MKKLLAIVVLGLLWSGNAYSNSIKMECAKHLIYTVNLSNNTVEQERYFLKKKGSSELSTKPNITIFPIEKLSNDIIITRYANYRHGWVDQANKLILDLNKKEVVGHGYKDSVEGMNKYPEKWERYNNPDLNIRYDYRYNCPGLKTIKSTSSNNTNSKSSNIKKTCLSFGYREGTEKFADCMKDLYLKE